MLLVLSVLYLIEILHQTTTQLEQWNRENELYLIEILHQTTTNNNWMSVTNCCILLKFYIKPQLHITTDVYTKVVSY